MSDYRPKEGSGNAFVNDYKTPDNNQPDFRGELNYKGNILEISMWKKVTSSNKPMLSLNVKNKTEQPKQEKATQQPKLEGWT